jgi:hypothetical protein
MPIFRLSNDLQSFASIYSALQNRFVHPAVQIQLRRLQGTAESKAAT